MALPPQGCPQHNLPLRREGAPRPRRPSAGCLKPPQRRSSPDPDDKRSRGHRSASGKAERLPAAPHTPPGRQGKPPAQAGAAVRSRQRAGSGRTAGDTPDGVGKGPGPLRRHPRPRRLRVPRPPRRKKGGRVPRPVTAPAPQAARASPPCTPPPPPGSRADRHLEHGSEVLGHLQGLPLHRVDDVLHTAGGPREEEDDRLPRPSANDLRGGGGSSPGSPASPPVT